MARGANYGNKRRVEFARHIFEGKTGPEAAQIMGIPAETAKDWMARDDVRSQIAEMKQRFAESSAKKAIITREAVLLKYWEFASINPELTKYNTDSQSRALTCIREMLGWTGPTPEEAEAEQKPDIYEPEWMKEQPIQ